MSDDKRQCSHFYLPYKWLHGAAYSFVVKVYCGKCGAVFEIEEIKD